MANYHTVLHYSNSVSIFNISNAHLLLVSIHPDIYGNHVPCCPLQIPQYLQGVLPSCSWYVCAAGSWHRAAGIFYCHVLGSLSCFSTECPSLYEMLVFIQVYTPDRETFVVLSCNHESFHP